MRINWHSLGAGILAAAATLVHVIDPTKLSGPSAAVLTVVGILVATFSRPAVQSSNSR